MHLIIILSNDQKYSGTFKIGLREEEDILEGIEEMLDKKVPGFLWVEQQAEENKGIERDESIILNEVEE